MNNEQTIELHCTSFKIFLDSVVTALIWPDTSQGSCRVVSEPECALAFGHCVSGRKQLLQHDFLTYAYGFLMPKREKSQNNMHRCMHHTGPQVAFLASNVLYLSVSFVAHTPFFDQDFEFRLWQSLPGPSVVISNSFSYHCTFITRTGPAAFLSGVWAPPSSIWKLIRG